LGHEQREKGKQFRVARLETMKRAADTLSKLLVELGPCHAVSVIFTMPDAEETQVGTHCFSGFYDPNMGSIHYAKASEVLEKYHLEIQKHLDKEALEKKAAQAAAAEGPPGVVVEHEKGGDDGQA